jgi:uncharacterized protein involved in exopolysaccharide biosynthesis
MAHGSRSVDDDLDESFDIARTKEMLALVLRSPRRRPKLAFLVFGVVLALAALAALRATPTYRAQAAIVVQKNAVLPTFGDASRNAPANDIDPAAGVSEAVKARDNLISLVRQTHLLDRTKNTASGTAASDEDRLQILLKILDRKITVTSDGSLVSFSADWNDAVTAYDLVAAALQNFLDSRTAAEVAIVSDAIGLLEEHATTEREGIDVAMEEFLRTKDGWKAPAVAGSGPRTWVPPPKPTTPDAAGVTRRAELVKRLDDTKQHIKEIEEDRRRQLSEMKSQLAQTLAVLTPSHPTAIGLRRKIEGLSEEPGNLATLKSEERSMLNELAAMTGSPTNAKSPGGTPGGVGPAGIVPMQPSSRALPPSSKQDLEIVDPASAMALSKLQSRVRKYEDFMDQISAAKLQLDLAKNAFKYRYSIYKPAEVPASPRYPIRLLLIVGGTLGAAILAALVAALVDLLGGRFVEPWQVKRKLSLPLLGEVGRP